MYIVCIIWPTKDDSLHLKFVLVPKKLVSWITPIISALQTYEGTCVCAFLTGIRKSRALKLKVQRITQEIQMPTVIEKNIKNSLQETRCRRKARDFRITAKLVHIKVVEIFFLFSILEIFGFDIMFWKISSLNSFRSPLKLVQSFKIMLSLIPYSFMHPMSLVQSFAVLCRIVQAFADFCRLLQAFADFCRLLQTFADFCRLVDVYGRIWSVQNSTRVFFQTYLAYKAFLQHLGPNNNKKIPTPLDLCAFDSLMQPWAVLDSLRHQFYIKILQYCKILCSSVHI